MSDTVIRVEKLGKKYTIGHQSERARYTALRDVVVQSARDLWSKIHDPFLGEPILSTGVFSAMIKTLAKRVIKRSWLQKYGKFLIRKTAAVFGLDLLTLAYQQNGILNYRNEYETGEYFVVAQWLKEYFTTRNVYEPCLMDIGANSGEFSRMLLQHHPNAKIFAFEPNPAPFERLQALANENPNIHPLMMALGEVDGEIEFYRRQGDALTTHATIYKDVMTEIHGYSDLQTVTVHIDTVDNFCSKYNIQQIDFLKIDTEGHELQVLHGAERALSSGIINSIQLEFNEMNIISRVFLRDFVELLADFNFYRLLPASLLPINYSSRHEIFMFQNLLAVRKDTDIVKRS